LFTNGDGVGLYIKHIVRKFLTDRMSQVCRPGALEKDNFKKFAGRGN
jgi:hypothetical protein